MTTACPHADDIADVAPPLDVCEACTAIGSTWVHLRQCLVCARTLCCDSSPNRHMTGHFHETGHPVMHPVDEGDPDIAWCFVDEVALRERPEGWETFDPFLETGLWFAERYLEGGHGRPGEDYLTAEGFPLGQWFAHVTHEQAQGRLRPRDREAIEALPGWSW